MELLREYYNEPQFESQSLDERFKTLLRAYCDQAAQFDIKIEPYSDETFSRFQSLTFERQTEIYNRFMIYYKICASASTSDVKLCDHNHSLVWWALKKLSLRPSSDLFHYLEQDDIIEIYDDQGVQIFRSFGFFRLCIYSLDQLLTYEWHELYKREEAITQAMLEMVKNLFTGNITDVYFPKFPDHIVEQNKKSNQLPTKIKHRFVAPLKGEDGRTYLFNAFQTSLI